MKKGIPIILVVALLLCGCNRGVQSPIDHTTDSVDSTKAVTTEPSEEDTASTEQTYSQQPMVAVSMPVVTETAYADDGTELSAFSYQTIQLVVQDQQVADSIIIDFLNRQDIHHSSAAKMHDAAVSDYHGSSYWNAYVYSSIYEPMRIDLNVLSLYGQTVVYSGGNHPHHESSAANYNMVTGEVLTLGSILTNVSALPKLQELVTQNMELIAEECQLYDDFPQIISQRFSREESYDEDWYFSQTGLNFFFAPYEVAPYVTGTVTVEVPYSQLTGIIDDSFFPGEADLSTGSVIAKAFGDIATESFTQIAEITLNPDGETIFLYTDGLVRNLRLETVGQTANTVFATYTLTPGDGIMIQAEMSAEASGLRLSYDRASERVVQYITMNAADHSVVLVDES